MVNYKKGDHVRLLGPYDIRGVVTHVYAKHMVIGFRDDDNGEERNVFYWDIEPLRPDPDWSITIVPDGDKTTATLHQRNKRDITATVVRYHDDQYDLFVAAEEAVKKLRKPDTGPYSGKAVFIGETEPGKWTRGRIYTFVNGKCYDDSGCLRPLYHATTIDGDDWYPKCFVKIIQE